MGTQDRVPAFSIVIPVLNEEQYLPQLLSDLSRQTFRDFEVILVDASSEDQTVIKARQFESRFDRLRILESDRRNVSHQRNLGAQVALADWLIFFDADNRLPRHFVQQITETIEVGKPDVLSSWFMPDSDNIIYKVIALLNNISVALYKNTRTPLIREAFVCVKKDVFLSLGGFDETVPFREGSRLLKRASQLRMKYILCREPKFICSYRRVRKQGILRTFTNSLRIDFARLINHPISEQASRILYPMEGGRYFEMSKTPRKESNRHSLKNVLRRIFKPL